VTVQDQEVRTVHWYFEQYYTKTSVFWRNMREQCISVHTLTCILITYFYPFLVDLNLPLSRSLCKNKIS
jgi:hypothetical protein